MQRVFHQQQQKTPFNILFLQKTNMCLFGDNNAFHIMKRIMLYVRVKKGQNILLNYSTKRQ